MNATKSAFPRRAETETIRVPTLDSNAKNMLFVPLRTYSLSTVVGLCGAMGIGWRLPPISYRLFSSMQITGSQRDRSRAYNSSSSYMRLQYSSLNAQMHRINRHQGL